MPVVQYHLRRPGLQQLLHRAGWAERQHADGRRRPAPCWPYGSFLTVTLNFIILALIIFVMIKQINRLKREARRGRRARAAATPEDIQLLREIRDSLKK